jgi:hypothetical protein
MRDALFHLGTAPIIIYRQEGGEFTMKTIFAAMFAVLIGFSFVGATFADEKKMDAPAAAPAGEMKKEEKKTETSKTETKDNGKKTTKKKKKTTEEKMEKK